MIEDYVLAGMNSIKEKCYADPQSGGLGLFKPNIFFSALKCSWVKRCLTLKHDNWRRLLSNIAGPAGLCYIQEEDAAACRPILRGIVKNFVFFRNCYSTIKNNFLFVPILNNTKFFFFRINRVNHILDSMFFENNLRLDMTAKNSCAGMNLSMRLPVTYRYYQSIN
jgi:hypothetical protein